jgi:peptidoglycan hydrolase-like protein with peptidoglycan-binding domain
MGKNSTEQLAIAKKYLGQGGSHFRKYCGLPSGSAWCDAFVTTIFAEAGNANLFCGGTKQTYCPTTIKWCRQHLAEVPPYLALPSDIIFFDWEPNEIPNHIGFVRERKDCEAIYTIEGNTSGGIVAEKVRNTKYVCGIYRPHFKGAFKIGKLAVDGYFGYNSIAMLQKALGVGVDGILGQQTVKALQRKCGASADGLWGRATSKAVQKWLGVTVDGYFGPNSVKALQTWINKVTASTPSTSIIDKELSACKAQADWMKNYTYKWVQNPTINGSKKYGTCVTYVACVLQRIGVLKSGQFIWHNGKGKVDGANSKMSVYYLGGTIKGNKSKLKRGDILIVGDKSSVGAGGNSHIMIFNGTWSGSDPYVWDNQSATRVRKGKSGLHTYGGGKKIIAVVRLK